MSDMGRLWPDFSFGQLQLPHGLVYYCLLSCYSSLYIYPHCIDIPSVIVSTCVPRMMDDDTYRIANLFLPNVPARLAVICLHQDQGNCGNGGSCQHRVSSHICALHRHDCIEWSYSVAVAARCNNILTFTKIPDQMSHSVQRVECKWSREDGFSSVLHSIWETSDKLYHMRAIEGSRREEVGYRKAVQH